MKAAVSLWLVLMIMLSGNIAHALPWKEEGIAQAIAAQLYGISEKPSRTLEEEELLALYQQNDFTPVWISEEGEVHSVTRDLIRRIQEADTEGLQTEDYHASALLQRMDAISLETLPEIDVAISKTLIKYVTDLKGGRKVPVEVNANRYSRYNVKASFLLQRIAQLDDDDATILLLTSPHPEYYQLKEALAHYRAIKEAGGWKPIPESEGTLLKPGMEDTRVPLLRKRLQAEGYLEKIGKGIIYDEPLKQAVRAFQRTHGLNGDGVIGNNTIAALNVPVEERITQLILNMERWRWLPEDIGTKHVLVNIAGFTLSAIRDALPVLEMRIIVGRPLFNTPVFSSEMTDVTFHPFWHVPKRIAVETLLPHIINEPGYLADKGYTVLQRGENDALEKVDSTKINWRQVDKENFPYTLRQDPGPKNSLGHIRFNITNDYSIYLHDTPEKELFQKEKRNFSAGCIRVQDPVSLAEFVLEDNPEWNRERIEAAYVMVPEGEKLKPLPVHLTESVPVHIVYFTTWPDKESRMHFQDDIYGQDEMLKKALFH